MSETLSSGSAANSRALNDPSRLNALNETRLLDSPPEEAFDRLTRLASTILHVPMSLVSLVDSERQFFKSCVGLPEPVAAARQTPLSHSFCQHVATSGRPLIVTDARQHPLLKDNLAIPMVGVIAYAGFPLVTPSGFALGSFCAIDTKPRVWTADNLEVLSTLAASTVTEIVLRLAVRQLRDHNIPLQA